jgi:hypothetical protein
MDCVILPGSYDVPMAEGVKSAVEKVYTMVGKFALA